MWPESSPVNKVNLVQNLLRFQRHRIFPRGLTFYWHTLYITLISSIKCNVYIQLVHRHSSRWWVWRIAPYSDSQLNKICSLAFFSFLLFNHVLSCLSVIWLYIWYVLYVLSSVSCFHCDVILNAWMLNFSRFSDPKQNYHTGQNIYEYNTLEKLQTITQ